MKAKRLSELRGLQRELREDEKKALASLEFPVDPVETKSSLRCTKCGSADIMTRWHSGGNGVSKCGGFTGKIACKKEEHMYQYCRGCAFEWHTPPLNL